MKKWKIKDYSYFVDVTFIIGTEDELEKFLLKAFPEVKSQRDFLGRHIMVNKTEHYVLLKLEDNTVTTWAEAALGHEVLHLTFAVLGNAGIAYCDDSEEAFTYYFQGMFAQMLREVLQYTQR